MKKISTLIIILSLFAINSFATNSTKLFNNNATRTTEEVSANEIKFNVTDEKKEDSNVNSLNNRNDVINRSSDKRTNSFEITPGQILSYSDGV